MHPDPTSHFSGPAAAAIGVFDSGLGGLSVLRALRSALPGARWLYLADSGHAPYGERSERHVQTRSLAAGQALVERGARLLVVACNTATALAIPLLRERWPDLPVVGVEPGLKPARQASRNSRIGVLATEATLASPRFRALLDSVSDDDGPRWTLQACPGLAAAIESGDLCSPALAGQVAGWCEPLNRAGVDSVVLGCTHYPFVADLIARALGPGVQLIDTAEAVARETARRWASLGLPAAAGSANTPAGSTRYLSSGDPATLARAARDWLGDTDAQAEAWRG